MTEEEANTDAFARNAELGRRGVTDRYWMAVETSPGVWEAQLHVEQPDRRPRWKRLLSALLDDPPVP